jgi:carbonic anhydrase
MASPLGSFASLALLLSIASLSAGCHAKPEVVAEPSPKKAAKKDAAKAEKKHEAKPGTQPAAEPSDPGKFIVPFAWEAATDEPLAQTRAFIAEALSDNRDYMEHGDKFFAAFADKQTPRATVLTCADSRVHSSAWDVTPENDDFMIRNIGNQVENAAGSIEYGIEHLRTPLLLVIGHTGCGAVKAAMGDVSKLSAPIQQELQHIHLPKPGAGKAPEAVWAEAVIANVDHQVETALKEFGKDVQAGQLTVVGAVFDFRNDLLQGAGKLVIVNVNGNSEPERMSAFVSAVTGKKELKEGAPGKSNKLAKLDTEAAAKIAAEIAKLHGAKLDAHASTAQAEPSHGAQPGHGH